MTTNKQIVVGSSKRRSQSVSVCSKQQSSSHQRHQVVGYEKTKEAKMVSERSFVNSHGDKVKVTQVCKVIERVKVVQIGSTSSSSSKDVKHSHSSSSKDVKHHRGGATTTSTKVVHNHGGATSSTKIVHKHGGGSSSTKVVHHRSSTKKY